MMKLQPSTAVLLFSVLLSSFLPCPHSIAAFSPQIRFSRSPQHRSPFAVTKLRVTTEEDVVALLKESEKLAAEALRLRQEAEALSSLAEEMAANAASSSEGASEYLKAGNLSLSGVAETQVAMDASLNAGNALENAIVLAEEADLAEGMAAEALKEVEEAFEKHLIDFPEADE
mmetsp:Transcript_15719/g.31331  ORF Transcript_15719/g.31331 Transcript_15719/m.31331 type:complete len:173 (+) Transcript_15719:74-592(+)